MTRRAGTPAPLLGGMRPLRLRDRQHPQVKTLFYISNLRRW